MKAYRAILPASLILIMFLCPLQTSGQNCRVVYEVTGINDSLSKIRIKWYTEQLILQQGVNVYRRETPSSAWVKMNKKPVLPAIQKPSLPENLDSINYSFALAIRENPQVVKDGILLLNIMVRSFENEEFAKILGICFTDSATLNSHSFQYEIRQVSGQKEITLGRSDWIKEVAKKARKIKGLVINQKASKIDLKWIPDDSSFYAVNIYRKAYQEEGFKKLNNNPLIISMEEDHQSKLRYPEAFYTDANPSSGKKYLYYLRGLDFFGKESYTSDTIRVDFADSIPPGIARDLRLSKSGMQVILNWTPPEDTDLMGFRVLRSYRSESNFHSIHNEIIEKGKCQYTDILTQPGPYYYKLQSLDSANNHSETKSLYTEIYDLIPPGVPTGVFATSDTNEVVLRWNKNQEEDIVGYLIYRSVGNPADSGMFLLRSDPIRDTFFVDNISSRVKKTIRYRVIAIDSSYNRSEYSPLCEIRMKDILAPERPVITWYNASEHGNALTWMQNHEYDLATYTVIRLSEKGESERFMLTKNSCAFLDTTVDYGKYYEYAVTASDSDGNESLPSVSCRIHSSYINGKSRDPIIKVSVSRKKHAVEFRIDMPPDTTLLGFTIYKAKEKNTLKRISNLIQQNAFTDFNVSRDSAYVYEFRFISNSQRQYLPQKFNIDLKR